MHSFIKCVFQNYSNFSLILILCCFMQVEFKRTHLKNHTLRLLKLDMLNKIQQTLNLTSSTFLPKCNRKSQRSRKSCFYLLLLRKMKFNTFFVEFKITEYDLSLDSKR
jgi:hypothetical protein